MSERRNHERRKWGRKVTYPFIDSDGVLVTKNRRRLVDRRTAREEAEEQNTGVSKKPLPPTLSDAQPSLDISESKVKELEDALKEEDGPASQIDESIKDLESQILTKTEKVSIKNFDTASANGKQDATKEEVTKPKSKPTPKPISKPKPEPMPVESKDENSTSIEISFKGNKQVLPNEKNSCVVGRDPACDIIVQGKFVSRAHAKIIYKEGKFLLLDESFNGTYIKFNNGQKIHVTKDEQTLISDGVMSMGEPVKDGKKSVIQFKILE